MEIGEGKAPTKANVEVVLGLCDRKPPILSFGGVKKSCYPQEKMTRGRTGLSVEKGE